MARERTAEKILKIKKYIYIYLIGEGAGENRVGQRRLKFEGTKPFETETWDGLLGVAADALVGTDLKIVRANVDEDLPLIVAAAISDSDLNSTLKPL